MIRNVTVYCSSSDKVAPVYFQAATELGRAIAREKWALIYGGNHVGVMGALADAARSDGGRVIGITPRYFVDQGFGDALCDELIVTAGMRERKAMLESRADALVVLPGGLGTLEELFDVLVSKSLGYHAKPIVLLNIAGFYSPLLAMIDEGIREHFIRAKAKANYYVADTVAQAMAYLRDIGAVPMSAVEAVTEPSATE